MAYLGRKLNANVLAVLCICSFLFVCLLTFTRHSSNLSIPTKYKALQYEIFDLENKLKHLEYVEFERSKLLKTFMLLTNMTTPSVSLATSDELAFEKSGGNSQNWANVFQALEYKLPSIYVHLPHLSDQDSMVPALLLKKSNRNAFLTIGIPTVPREKQNYLFDTLQSLVGSLESVERSQILIVVLIAERGLTPEAKRIVKELESNFSSSIHDGLLEVVVPPKKYYPSDIDTMKGSFNDSPERTRWRTKQNLDYMYLFSYCRNRGLYYMQLEDDVVTKPNYLSYIQYFIESNKMRDWFMLEFSSLGFIGKLFRTRSLPMLINFVAMFYKDMPVDWLLSHLLSVRYCGLDKNPKECQKLVRDHVMMSGVKLFQHVGLQSSLRGKMQKLKEKNFSNDIKTFFVPHLNPACITNTSLKAFKKMTLDSAYKGASHFWAFAPKANDYILFHFPDAVNLTGFRFKAGSPDHEEDVLYWAQVELKATSPTVLSGRPLNEQGYYVMETSNKTRLFESTFPSPIATSHLRISFLRDSDKWLLLSEIWIRTSAGH